MGAGGGMPQAVIDRILIRCHAEGSCMVSDYQGPRGYGRVAWKVGDRYQHGLVHRRVWEAVNGPIPEGLTVDHLCRVRKCIRIEHLRLLSHADNSSDTRRRRTHC